MSMKCYTLSMLTTHLNILQDGFSNAEGHERAAYLFCRRAVTSNEVRLIVQSVEIVQPEHILSSSREHVSISSRSYVPTIARADREGQSFILVHNHPDGYPSFSPQDDSEEPALFRTAFIRCPLGPHGSIVLVGQDAPRLIGRVWLDDQHSLPIERIRIIGDRIRIFDWHQDGGSSIPNWADRQVRAFGEDTQRLLSKLHIGVVGAGGTGSAVIEQLIRLGVGKVTVIDYQEFEGSNVNRVYGSRLSDEGTLKIDLARRQALNIGTGTEVIPIRGSVCDVDTAKTLRECDIIFGCTDDDMGRTILNRLAVWYYIPVIDMAVIIDSEQGTIHEVTGRITRLLPGKACLHCRERVDHAKLRSEQLARLHPTEHASLVREGYAPELGQNDPAVIMFTTIVAARAVTELLQMLTGFMGNDRTSSEILERFHETEVRTNNRSGKPDCYCMLLASWGRGDQDPFLDITW